MDSQPPKEQDSIRESVIARNLMRKLGKKKVRIKRLVKKSDGNLTLRDTTILNQTQDSMLPNQVNNSQFSQVDYKFTRMKDPNSFTPEFESNYQSEGGLKFDNSETPYLSNQNFSKKKKNFSKKPESKTPMTINKVQTFTQMIEKDIRTSKQIEPISEKQSVFNSISVPSMTQNSEFSTESDLFRLPNQVGVLAKDVNQFKISVKQKVENEKKLTLLKFEVFKNRLISTIAQKLNLYQKELIKEYDQFYDSYETDLEFLHNKCKAYENLPKAEIDINKNKVQFTQFDYFEEGKAVLLKSEKSQIVTFPENVEVLAKKKELNFLFENLEKRIIHIPGFAKTETANECMEDTVTNLDKFCSKNLDFLENVLYKTNFIPLKNLRVKYDFIQTDIKSSRQSVQKFKTNNIINQPKQMNQITDSAIAENNIETSKEIHNIWEKSIEHQKLRESNGLTDECTQQELKKRQQMLNSMKQFDEQVKQYNQKLENNQNPLNMQKERKQIGQNLQDSEFCSEKFESDFKINPATQSPKKLIQENLIQNNLNQAPKHDKNIIEPIPQLTEEQKMIMQQNRAKQELFLKKQSEMKFNEAKSTYEKMSVYSMREEHLGDEGKLTKEDLAKKNLENLNTIMGGEDQKADLENLLDSNQFNSRNSTPANSSEKTETAEKPRVNALENNQENPKKENKPVSPARANVEDILRKYEENRAKSVKAKGLNLEFKRSNINIEKIVKGKELNGVIQTGNKLFFFGDEFIFKCSLTFQNPVMYKLGGKDLTFLRSIEKEVGPDHYLLGITNKHRKTSEILLIRLTQQFSLMKRICIEEQEASGIINIFNLTNQKQFISVTRFGEVHLCDFSEPTIVIKSKENLNSERIETAILTARESSLCLVSQNSQIIGIEIVSQEGKAVKVLKSRILPLDNQANDIVKVSEDQVGYCDEDGMFSLLTLPMELNGNKLGIKKTKVCDFPVDKLFILESQQNQTLDYRMDINRILVLNYEGYVQVFDFRNRKAQKHFDPKLVHGICLHSQNALLSTTTQKQHDLLILSTSTLKKLMVHN